MPAIDLKDLIKTGIHFGHRTCRWHPLMNPYIWGQRGGVHLVNVAYTAQHLENAARILSDIAAQNKQVLFVGTKKAAQKAIETGAKETNMPYVNNRWIGGTLTNYSQVKKSVTKLMHFEDIIKRSADFNYTKKELSNFQKIIERLNENIGGIRQLSWPIGAVVLIDIKKEDTALREARAAGVPVIALVDTNCDPSLVNYVIPGNDDSPRAIAFVVDYLAQAVKQGTQKAKANQQKHVTGKTSEEQQAPASRVEITDVEKAMLTAEEDATTGQTSKKGKK